MRRITRAAGAAVVLSLFMLVFSSCAQDETATTVTVADEATEPTEEETTGEMSFFITSKGPGNGADLGGLAGADKYCQTLAAEAGAGDKTWRAYLSTSGADGENARDRIGTGPWFNAKGEMIAADLDELHGDNNISKETALDEKGGLVNGRGDDPNRHDILTGSSADGTLYEEDGPATCDNWTSSGDGAARVGHHDRQGLDESDEAKSWNSSHDSRGCSQEGLIGTGGDGLFYCFAREE